MQYTDGLGIVATKQELAALLAFTSDSEKTSNVSIKLEPGHIIAWATNGIGAAYCHGDTWDGSGKPSKEVGAWQIPSEAIAMVAKSMGKGHEAILIVDRKGHLKEAKIRDIESSEEKGIFRLDKVATSGVLFDLRDIAPARPNRDQMERCVGQITLAPSLLSLLVKVAKAAHCDTACMYMPTSGIGAVYVEVDEPSRLADSEQPRWCLVLMPQGEKEEPVGSADDDAEQSDDAEDEDE